MPEESNISHQHIENKIYTIRNEQVMLDRDLAEMYQVETRVLNQAVKRNVDRFPANFCFQLLKDEAEEIFSRSQFVTLKDKRGKNIKYLPYVFTEQGVAMLSAVLRSDVAIKVSIQIINAFVQMRKLIGQETIQHLRLSTIENKLIEHDQKFNKLFDALESSEFPQRGIYFDGQVYDAYKFAGEIIKKAKSSIILLDNYVDDTVLTLLSKRKNEVKATIFTSKISKQLALDIEKHNKQYAEIEVKPFKHSHDRFLILDEKELYHIGASLKDLGKKWFAFSKMDIAIFDLLKRLNKDVAK